MFENAASRADEKELQVFELEEQVERVTAQMEMVQKGTSFYSIKLNMILIKCAFQMRQENGQRRWPVSNS